MAKNPPANEGDIRDVGSIPRLGTSPGGGHGNPLQYSCLENPMNRGVCWVTVHNLDFLEPKKIKSVTVSTVSPFICHEMMGLDAVILVFRMLSFKPAFPRSSFTLIKRLFSSSSLSATRVVYLYI